MSDDTRSCDFCDEFNNPTHSAFAEQLPGRRRDNLWRTADFAVLPTLGPLAFGHVLVVPSKHVTSFAALDETAALADDVLAMTRGHLETHIGPTLAFEHGSVAAGTSGGCGVAHAHVHLVPANVRHCPELPGIEWIRVGGSPAAGRASAGDYLYFSPSDGTHYMASVREIPSQMLRTWLGKQLGEVEWNWRTHARPELVESTLAWMIEHPLPLAAPV